MPKYNVILSYYGAYNVIVDAPNEDSAIDYARAEVDAIDEITFLRAICVQENGIDIYKED